MESDYTVDDEHVAAAQRIEQDALTEATRLHLHGRVVHLQAQLQAANAKIASLVDALGDCDCETEEGSPN